MSGPDGYRVFPVRGLPEVQAGDDLAALIDGALHAQGTPLEPGDVLVVTQKIVSKAEGRLVRLADVAPGARARAWAAAWDKDARQVELVLREAARIVRMERGVIITETREGWVCANAGIDQSNIGGPDGEQDVVSLLPVDSSASARRLRAGLAARGQPGVGLIISDTFGRPWRDGLTNVAIGVSGMAPLRSYVGQNRRTRLRPAGHRDGHRRRAGGGGRARDEQARPRPRRRRARAGHPDVGGRRLDARAPGGDGSVPLSPASTARRVPRSHPWPSALSPSGPPSPSLQMERGLGGEVPDVAPGEGRAATTPIGAGARRAPAACTILHSYARKQPNGRGVAALGRA